MLLFRLARKEKFLLADVFLRKCRHANVQCLCSVLDSELCPWGFRSVPRGCRGARGVPAVPPRALPGTRRPPGEAPRAARRVFSVKMQILLMLVAGFLALCPLSFSDVPMSWLTSFRKIGWAWESGVRFVFLALLPLC